MEKQTFRTGKFLILLILFGGFAACSSDSGPSGSDDIGTTEMLYGKWELFRYESNEGNGNYEHGCAQNKDYWNFTETANAYQSHSWDPDCEMGSAIGTWNKTGNTLTINAADADEPFHVTYEILELTDTTLKVKEADGNHYWIDILKKIN